MFHFKFNMVLKNNIYFFFQKCFLNPFFSTRSQSQLTVKGCNVGVMILSQSQAQAQDHFSDVKEEDVKRRQKGIHSVRAAPAAAPALPGMIPGHIRVEAFWSQGSSSIHRSHEFLFSMLSRNNPDRAACRWSGALIRWDLPTQMRPPGAPSFAM